MIVNKIQKGVYKIKDSEGTWIAKGGFATVDGKWTAYDSNTYEDCTIFNNWGVRFDTFKQLKEFAKRITLIKKKNIFLRRE